ncbi:MAG: TonB-dependent receptor plug [Segetibacter sp.]|nr:TonB-dependent receptor plug [Segetibacter sp.]
MKVVMSKTKRFIVFTTILTLTSYFGYSQTASKISGKILNGKNEPLSGVSITIEGQTKGTSTDVEGNFIFSAPASKALTIKVSTIGYKEKTISDINVAPGKTEELNIILEEVSKKLENVVVRSSGARKESVNALIAYQKNTSTVAQVISAEAIRRSPDKNTGEILKRIPGTSVQEGKYLVVRGLSDRYNQAMLNGILLSSTEPDRKTFSFDIFPSSMIDNIIINKSFIPELSGEWAGGLVQVNTKDVPSANFLNVQIGTGFNTQTIGKDFYTYKGGKLDWLGIDDGTRGLPAGLPTKTKFSDLGSTKAEQNAFGRQFENIWSAQKNSSNILPVLNKSFQLSGGFNKPLSKSNKLGAIFALTYNQQNKRTEFQNTLYSFQNNVPSVNFDYNNNKYSQDVLWGALGNVTLQLGAKHKISFKNLININSTNYVTNRTGKDFEFNSSLGENIKATELALKSNTFFNTQISGDHNFPALQSKLHWYGSFNILDQYIPDQRRLQYNQDPETPNAPYIALIATSKTSQKSGSRYYGFLNDYIYNTGADVATTFKLGDLNQTVKAGYFFQVKDRLFDSRPFAIYIPSGENKTLQTLPADQIFNPENFGNGADNKFAFNELAGDRFRYIANTILNAGFLQFDNQFSNKLRATWGVRVEDYDQVIGSLKQSDPRHLHTRTTDLLPGFNLTYKVTNNANIRLSGSQTVIRPEFRELSDFQFYDFELGATVAGYRGLVRTKVTNADLRYELYPRAGELFTVGVFYKYFKNPIESYFNAVAGGGSSYNFLNADKANGYGAELELRKKLDFTEALRNFTFQTNLSYIYNRVESKTAQIKRPMQGQSPYVFNASLQYDIEKLGINTTLLYNQIGDRILYVGGDNTPPIWEASRPLIDFQLAKKIMKNKAELKLNASDILNQATNYYVDGNQNGKYDKGLDALAIRRKFGTNISFSFAYNIR